MIAAIAAGTPSDATANHRPGHIAATVGPDDICWVDGPVHACPVVGSTQDFVDRVTCVDLLGEKCVYRQVRTIAGEQTLPGAPTVTLAALLALAGRPDCVTEVVGMDRESGGLCMRSGGSRHNFFDCGSLPDHTWCVSNERHSYYYGTATYDGESSSDIWTCFKFIRDDNGNQIARACSYNYAALDVGDSPLKKPLIYNGDDYRRTIQGYARF